MTLKKKNDVLNQIIIWTCAGFWNYDFRKLRTTNNSNKLAKINDSKITNSVKITSKKFRNSTKFHSTNQVFMWKLNAVISTWFFSFVFEIYIRDQTWVKVKFKVVHLLYWFCSRDGYDSYWNLFWSILEFFVFINWPDSDLIQQWLETFEKFKNLMAFIFLRKVAPVQCFKIS